MSVSPAFVRKGIISQQVGVRRRHEGYSVLVRSCGHRWPTGCQFFIFDAIFTKWILISYIQIVDWDWWWVRYSLYALKSDARDHDLWIRGLAAQSVALLTFFCQLSWASSPLSSSSSPLAMLTIEEVVFFSMTPPLPMAPTLIASLLLVLLLTTGLSFSESFSKAFPPLDDDADPARSNNCYDLLEAQ